VWIRPYPYAYYFGVYLLDTCVTRYAWIPSYVLDKITLNLESWNEERAALL